jgi:hypothetical protein
VRSGNVSTNENGTEVFQGTGSFKQTVSGLKSGLYKVTFQGMYRDGSNANVAKYYDAGYNQSYAYVEANGTKMQVKSWAADRASDSNPNSMAEFAALAAEGKYAIDGLTLVGEDGVLTLTVNVPAYIGSGWFIADNVTYTAAQEREPEVAMETGMETEKNATIGAANAPVEGQSYTVAGTYNAGAGGTQAGNMTSKGFKARTGADGARVVFAVNENYTITKFVGEAIANYAMKDGAEGDVCIKAIKVEVDGQEVDFTGGEFPAKGSGTSGNITIDNIKAKESIAIYFDNSNAAGTQLNLTYAINWERPMATQPTIAIAKKSATLIAEATYKLTAKVDPAKFESEVQWVSSDMTVATVAEDGTVTAVAPGTADIMLMWANGEEIVADTAVITVADFDVAEYVVAKETDFTTLGDVTLTIASDAAGVIWNEGNKKANSVFFCTNEGLEDVAVQAVESSNKGWSVVDGEGLKLASGAGRCAAIGGLKAGQVVEIIYSGNNFYTGSKDDAVRKDDGAVKKTLNEGIGRAIYEMSEDGMIGFELDKGNAVQKVIVYELKTVGISNVIKAAAENGDVYDMQGRKQTGNLRKGLYILNGKVISVK